MHGLNGKASWFDSMQDWIRQKHGNVTMFSFPIAEEKGSLLNLWDTGSKVMDSLRAKVTEAPHLYENGYALVCHSQGALLCRTIVERMDDHNVHTLIALAGPQQGVYGIPSGWQDYLPWARDEVYHFAYLAGMQDHLSIANYWHDVRPESGLFHPVKDYWAGNTFLPVLNNDPNRATQGPGHSKNETTGQAFKENMLRLKKAVFTCSPADDQVIPYDSGIFNFFDQWADKGTVPLQQTRMWTEDWIGLRGLQEAGRLVRIDAPDIPHNDWVRNQDVFLKYVEGHLPHAKSQTVFV